MGREMRFVELYTYILGFGSGERENPLGRFGCGKRGYMGEMGGVVLDELCMTPFVSLFHRRGQGHSDHTVRDSVFLCWASLYYFYFIGCGNEMGWDIPLGLGRECFTDGTGWWRVGRGIVSLSMLCWQSGEVRRCVDSIIKWALRLIGVRMGE